MALINFSSSVCNYTTSAKVIAAAPGSIATNSYEYVDLEMVPDSGYYLDVTNFTYLSNDYVDYVTFMPDGINLKARVYLKSFTWPSERTDLEVPISGCASLLMPTTTTTTTIAPTTTTTTAAPVCPAISGYFINKSIIELRGETRIFKVYGQKDATFSYTIIDNDNSFTLKEGTETIPYSGFVNIEVIVPLSDVNKVFDVTITTDEPCTLQLQTQPATFKLYQGISEEWIGDTYECCEEAGVLLSTNCVGFDKYGVYTDGQCGTTNSLIEANSTDCGYATTTTTQASTTTTTAAPTPFAQITGATAAQVNDAITLTGEDYNFTGSTWAWTGGAAEGLTSKVINITETSAGTITYGVTIDGTYTDNHNVTWQTEPTTTTTSTTTTTTSTTTTTTTEGPATYNRDLSLTEAVTDNPTYSITFTDTANTVNLISTGSGASKQAEISLTNTNITVTVNRTAPDSTADDATSIVFTLRNSNNVVKSDQTLSVNPGNAVTNQSYTFTNVAAGDTMYVAISEG